MSIMKLTDKQIDLGRSIVTNPEVIKARKALLLYKANDEGLALFRTTARNHYSDMVMRIVSNKVLLSDTSKFLAVWLSEPDDSYIGNIITDLYNAIQLASGKTFKHGNKYKGVFK